MHTFRPLIESRPWSMRDYLSTPILLDKATYRSDDLGMHHWPFVRWRSWSKEDFLLALILSKMTTWSTHDLSHHSANLSPKKLMPFLADRVQQGAKSRVLSLEQVSVITSAVMNYPQKLSTCIRQPFIGSDPWSVDDSFALVYLDATQPHTRHMSSPLSIHHLIGKNDISINWAQSSIACRSFPFDPASTTTNPSSIGP